MSRFPKLSYYTSGLARCVCTYKAPNRIPARILMLPSDRNPGPRRTFQLDLAPAYSQMAKFVTGLLNFWRERCWWNMHARIRRRRLKVRESKSISLPNECQQKQGCVTCIDLISERVRVCGQLVMDQLTSIRWVHTLKITPMDLSNRDLFLSKKPYLNS